MATIYDPKEIAPEDLLFSILKSSAIFPGEATITYNVMIMSEKVCEEINNLKNKENFKEEDVRKILDEYISSEALKRKTNQS